MSVAVQWSGPGRDCAETPFFLCVKREPGKKAVDEWSTGEADELASELSARIACEALGLVPEHWEPVKYPAKLRSARGAQKFKQRPEWASYRSE